MSSDACKVVLIRFIEEVWNRGELAGADRFVADRYTIRHDPGDPWEGRTLDLAGFKDRVSQSRAPFPDQRFEIQDLVGEGRSVAMTWLWSATHRGDLPGFPASGRTVRMSGATLYDFDPGMKLTGHWQIRDEMGVFRQLSRGPAPASAT